VSEKVSCLCDVTLRRSRYMFIVVNESDYSTDVQKALVPSADVFGAKMGWRGRLVQAYPNATNSVYREVLAKEWSREIIARMEGEPVAFLMIIGVDFRDFNPSRDEWAIVWLSAFGNASRAIPYSFDLLDREIQRGGELFDYLRAKYPGADRRFPHGALSVRGGTLVPAPQKKKGRKSVLDRLNMDVAGLVEFVENRGIEVEVRGWKMKLSLSLEPLTGGTTGLSFKAKSISDGLQREGLFDEIIRRLNAKKAVFRTR
jgi:hypothetical protein